MMRINWIEFENLDTELKINKVNFNKELTLLVGRSGAGKTQILQAISMFCSAATIDVNEIACAFKGTISFSINNLIFEWTVHVSREDIIAPSYLAKKINNEIYRFISPKETNFIVKSESLLCNGEQIFERSDTKLIMNGQELPQISNDFSLIYQYKSDNTLKNVYDCMHGLYTNDMYDDFFTLSVQISLLDKIKSELLDSDTENDYRDKFPVSLTTPYKIYLLKETDSSIGLYTILLEYYKKIFSDIDDFVFEVDYENRRIKTYVRTNNANIPYSSLSAGMRRTLSFLVDLLTMSNNYVVLIDEIENGLGVNCLDEVYDLLTSLRTDLQLIITSHHPYIINNVNPASCKIVDRKRNVISTYSAQELHLTNSHHDFYDLVMNKLQYGDMP